MNNSLNKIIHYITLVAMVLLIIPSGFKSLYFHIFCIVLGIFITNKGLQGSNKNTFSIVCGII
ncbi:hypothetical protein, partial [Priestia megaterium]|uniref:hypothetical protein n=1 Tax=Priestia megaterium TaxID=1404 RepID=UPI001B3A372A